MRTTLDRLRSVAPDVHDFDHSALAAAEAISSWRAEDETLFA
jgi:hypothetical protein